METPIIRCPSELEMFRERQLDSSEVSIDRDLNEPMSPLYHGVRFLFSVSMLDSCHRLIVVCSQSPTD